ncbi:ArsR family transcriptional regulator [Acetobacter musti]|uniref:ArsR family transcriptional regulator n=1 Tax=Acetobacter musti TaxID=864732 RepID=A0ABX0JWU3_9PROT|nr:aryl-sulfate sulfotransferase [Acetobacter musti]NHN86493.1 ArsR family transcriptional regulator [Acetobacter musti]
MTFIPRAAFLSLLAAGLFCGLSAAQAMPGVFPTGVTTDRPGKTYDSFVMFSGPDGATHLIDMTGREVHRWAHPGLPGAMMNPAVTGGAKGHTLLQTESVPDAGAGVTGNRTVSELDWDGHEVWRWSGVPGSGGARQNHDWARLAGGDTLLLVAVTHPVAALDGHVVNDQAIEEVAPDGRVVWRWVAGDHLREFGLSAAGLAYLKEETGQKGGPDAWGYLEINDMQPLGPNRWFDAGDARFRPDNIMIDSRKGNFVVIIDRRTGHVVWRLGPDFPGTPHEADRRLTRLDTPRPVDQLSGQHDAHLIPEGLPGAGNLLLFDDQGPAGFPRVALGVYGGSRVLEIDPVSRQIVWDYTAVRSGLPPWAFFSSFVSSAQRLPNGNTLIDEGMNGRIFQVTPGGEIVWEYVNPYRGQESFGGARVSSAMVYRAQAVPADWLPLSLAPRPVARP